MPKRKAWNGSPPSTPAEARRVLLEAARDCLERLGPTKANLSDVAQTAGVTRQTVYRYFEDADDLFHSAAVLATGGLRERMRAQALRQPTPATRIVECLVFCAREVPADPHLAMLGGASDRLSVSTALRLSLVQEEMTSLSGGQLGLTDVERDELAELLLRLMHSLLTEPGEPRSEVELRAFLTSWLVPMIEARMG